MNRPPLNVLLPGRNKLPSPTFVIAKLPLMVLFSCRDEKRLGVPMVVLPVSDADVGLTREILAASR